MPTEPNDIPSRLASLVAQMKETTGGGAEGLTILRDQVSELRDLTEGRPAVNYADGLSRTFTNVAGAAFRQEGALREEGLHLIHSGVRAEVVNVADRIARLDQVWAAYASNFANLTRDIRSLGPIPSDPSFRAAALSFADRIAQLGKDLAAYAQAEVRLVGAFSGLDRKIVDLPLRLGFLGLGDETRYNFAGDGKYLTLAERVHSKVGLGRMTAGALFTVAIGAVSAVEAARELAGGKSFMATMENVTNPITARIVNGLTIASAAASDATHSIPEKTGVIQSGGNETQAPTVAVVAARSLTPDGIQTGQTVSV